MRSTPHLTIFTDGGARGNPGPAAIGMVIKDGLGHVIHQSGHTIGQATNNTAEYQAVIAAYAWIAANSPSQTRTIQFFLDSNLVVNQLSGKFKIKKPHLLDLYRQVKSLEIKTNSSATYSYIPRAQNSLADSLLNQALDNQAP